MYRKTLFGIVYAGLAIVALGFAKPAQAQTNLIVNGSFEDPQVGWGWFGSFPGWTLVSGDVMEIGWAGIYGVSGQDGNQVIELDGHDIYGGSSNVRIKQTVPTIPGRTYTLKCKTAIRAGTYLESNQVTVYWNGAVVDVIRPTSTVMQQSTFTVVATGTSTDVEFEGGQYDWMWEDTLGSMLDDVSLVLDPYNVCLLYDPAKLHKSGSTIPIKLQLCDGNGSNLSSSGTALHAVQILNVGNAGTGTPEDSGSANPDNDFRYDPTLGGTGGYIFNLSTKGLASGSYVLRFQVVGEGYTYEAGFQIR